MVGLRLCAFALIFLTAAGSARAEEPLSCDVPELAAGTDTPYNLLVCEGIAEMEAENYAEAAQSFEKALATPIHEFPNFMLYPRLALAYWGAGNVEQWRRNLRLAELTLSVFTGVLKCGEERNDLALYHKFEGRLSGPLVEEAALSMCGDIYQGYYRKDSLEQVLGDAELVRMYMSAKTVKITPLGPDSQGKMAVECALAVSSVVSKLESSFVTGQEGRKREDFLRFVEGDFGPYECWQAGADIEIYFGPHIPEALAGDPNLIFPGGGSHYLVDGTNYSILDEWHTQ